MKITEIGLLQAFLGGFLISAQSISVLSCCVPCGAGPGSLRWQRWRQPRV
nr:MAG TPA: hypothetical protein [Caudoviricetes sp.]